MKPVLSSNGVTSWTKLSYYVLDKKNLGFRANNSLFEMHLLGIILLIRIYFAAPSANDSYCIDYTNFTYVSPLTVVPYEDVQRRHGTVDCLNGDIVLAGKYINLGNKDKRKPPYL